MSKEEVRALLVKGITLISDGKTAEGIKLLEQAAEAGNRSAYRNLALIYCSKESGYLNKDKFLFWLQKLADHPEDGWGKIFLGTIYASNEIAGHPLWMGAFKHSDFNDIKEVEGGSFLAAMKGSILIAHGVSINDSNGLDYLDYYAIASVYLNQHGTSTKQHSFADVELSLHYMKLALSAAQTAGEGQQVISNIQGEISSLEKELSIHKDMMDNFVNTYKRLQECVDTANANGLKTAVVEKAETFLNKLRDYYDKHVTTEFGNLSDLIPLMADLARVIIEASPTASPEAPSYTPKPLAKKPTSINDRLQIQDTPPETKAKSPVVSFIFIVIVVSFIGFGIWLLFFSDASSALDDTPAYDSVASQSQGYASQSQGDVTEVSVEAEANMTSPSVIEIAVGPPLPGLTGRTSSAIDTGGGASFAIIDGQLWGWGRNESGGLGDGTSTDHHSPIPIIGDVIVAVVASSGRTMAITSGETLLGWGGIYVGDGALFSDNTPATILFNVRSVFSAHNRTMAIRTDGSLWGWGEGRFNGEVGVGRDADILLPEKVMDSVVSVEMGYFHTLAITEDGGLWSWGNNSTGRLGDGTTEARNSPVRIMDNVIIAYIDSTWDINMALTADGGLWRWGTSWAWGLEGLEDYDGTYPVKIFDNAVNIGSLMGRPAAITLDGILWIWAGGSYDSGWFMPIINNVIDMASTMSASFALTTDGNLWDVSSFGFASQPDGSFAWGGEPVLLLSEIVAITSGGQHMIAKEANGQIWAWGDNSNGQVGDGTREYRNVPVSIAIP